MRIATIETEEDCFPPQCDECDKNIEIGVVFEEYTFDPCPWCLCSECLQKALNLIKGEKL